MEINNEFNTALKLVYKAANEETKKALETNFPQLRENEDEGIRKGLIHHLKELQEWKGDTLPPIKVKGHYDAWIAYLEKQKEQKPSTPKFRVGDVMRTKQEAAKGITDGLPVIVSVDDNYYYCTNEKIPISEQEEYEFPPMNMRQKPAEWSEEDEKKLNGIINCLCCTNGDIDGFDEWYDWLKDLPERFNLQPKQVWSEEEKKKISELKTFIAQCNGFNKENLKKAFDMIDALRPQPNWNPSKEQMEAVKCAASDVKRYSSRSVQLEIENKPYYSALISLYDDLKNYFNL